MGEARLSGRERLYCGVQIAKGGWWTWIGNGEGVTAYIWMTRLLFELDEPLLVTEMCADTVFDVDKGLEYVGHPGRIRRSSEVGMT